MRLTLAIFLWTKSEALARRVWRSHTQLRENKAASAAVLYLRAFF